MVVAWIPGVIGAQGRPPVIPLRYAEDNTYLADPNRRTESLDSLKYISLGPAPGSYLSLGGQVRQMYERFENPAGEVRDWWPTRLMVNADLNLADGRFRLFGHLASGFLLNDQPPRPIDVDRLYVLNLFGEARLKRFGGMESTEELRLRVGRIELNYGAARLITLREGPNVRHYWDGGQLLLRRKNWKFDALFVSYGATLPGYFDDPVLNGQENLWGLYATNERRAKNQPTRTVDIYYLGLDDRSRAFFSRAGQETRHTLGARWARKSATLELDVEGMGQFGEAGEQSIRAYGLSAMAEYTLRSGPNNGSGVTTGGPGIDLGLMIDYWSGDRDTTDRVLNNFNPLYPRQGYYRGAGQLFPSNFFDIAVYAAFDFGAGLTASTGYTYYWRTSTQDGIYTGGAGRPTLAPRPLAGQHALGGQFDATLGYAYDRHLTLNAKYSRFWADGFVEATPTPQEIRHFFNIILSYRI